MKSRKNVWTTGSVLVGAAALVAALAIPLVASANAKHPATIVHCHIKSDQVVDISQFANDQLSVQAHNAKCSVSMTGSYKSGALITPVTVLTKLTKNAAGTTPGYTGQIKTRIFTGTVTTALVNPKGATGGSYRVKIRVGCDFDPSTVFIEISW